LPCTSLINPILYLEGAEKLSFFGLLKNARMQGVRILRTEAYLDVRRKTKGEDNAADGLFSAAS